MYTNLTTNFKIPKYYYCYFYYFYFYSLNIFCHKFMNKYYFLSSRTTCKYYAVTDYTINRICNIKNKRTLYIHAIEKLWRKQYVK